MTEEAELEAEAHRIHETGENHRWEPGMVCQGPTKDEWKMAKRVVAQRHRDDVAAGQRAYHRHRHVCVTRRCKAPYTCVQACTKDARSDSLCPACYAVAASGGFP